MKLWKKKKYTSHAYHYKVQGEDVAKRKRIQKRPLQIAVGITCFAFLLVNYVFITIKRCIETIVGALNNGNKITQTLQERKSYIFHIKNAITLELELFFYLLMMIGLIFLLLYSYIALARRAKKSIAYGQKGDSRLSTIQEIREQYKEIPDRGKSFPGIGGIPISHYEDNYYIDTDTVNTCVLGVSRSGKDEIIANPMIDNISRAEIKCSMVINDPKGELVAASKETLEKRGFEVEILNNLDPENSMSYNMLELVKDAWMEGNESEASKRAAAVTDMLYRKEDAGENEYFYDSAGNAVAAIILAITEMCIRDGHPERITMPNVADMLLELGGYNYKDNPDDFQEKNALDEFFAALPQGNTAKKKYATTSFAKDRQKGSILSLAYEGLQPFINPASAKMISKNNLDLKSIGFPKYLEGQLHPDLSGQWIVFSFYGKDQSLKDSYKVKIREQGYFTLNFDVTLKQGDYLMLKSESYENIYKLKFLPSSKEVQLIKLKDLFLEKVKKIRMRYSEKPVAVFLVVADYDASKDNNMLASIFIKQLYIELLNNCMSTKGKKCHRRVHFILNEFGNMNQISDILSMLTACLSRDILFTLYLQSYYQLDFIYKGAAKIIKENCQNKIYIASTDPDTIEEISKNVGHKTDISLSSMEQHLEIDSRVTKSADQIRWLPSERLSQMIEGETVVLRPLHRKDNHASKVRPYPIFNTKETVMPYRYEFLSEWLDPEKDISQIDIYSEHAGLNLRDLQIDFSRYKKGIGGEQDEREWREFEELPKDPKDNLIDRIKEVAETLPKLSPQGKKALKLVSQYKRGKEYSEKELAEVLYSLKNNVKEEGV